MNRCARKKQIRKGVLKPISLQKCVKAGAAVRTRREALASPANPPSYTNSLKLASPSRPTHPANTINT